MLWFLAQNLLLIGMDGLAPWSDRPLPRPSIACTPISYGGACFLLFVFFFHSLASLVLLVGGFPPKIKY